MDAGGLHPLREAGSRRDNFQSDRFIPVRSGMDFDVAHQMLTQPRRQRERIDALLHSDDAYQKLLVEVLLQNRTRILAFNNRPRPPVGGFFDVDGICSSPPTKMTMARRRHIPRTADRVLDAPELMDDYSLNLLDWGRSNLISIALGCRVCLWDADKGSAAELMNVDEDKGPVTSVSWAPDGQHIAVGLNSSDIQLWDLSSHRLLRVLQGVHESRVGSMAWNSNTILTTGGLDGLVANSDMRVRSHVVQTFRGHQSEICGLKWAGSGRQLASGGNDKLMHIWDISVASAHPRPTNNRWIHRFEDHLGAVRALAWCPFRDNVIASGGGAADQSIKLWNTQTGDCLNSFDASSQVYGLLWSRNEWELLSSHGGAQNQLRLWKYPSMVKIRDLVGHSSRVLFLAQSPDGSRVASAAGAEDETLRVWNVFGIPDAPKPAARGRIRGSFADIIQIRLRAPS